MGFIWLVRHRGLSWLPNQELRDWIEGHRKRSDAPVLDKNGERRELRPKGRNTEYNALHEATGLFTRFAQLRGEPNEIIDFIIRHGLTPLSEVKIDSVDADEVMRLVSDAGGTLGDWMNNQRTFAMLFDLWVGLKGADKAWLKQHIRWHTASDGSRFVAYRDERLSAPGSRREGRSHEFIASRKVRPEWLAEFKDGDVQMPGWAYLQERINENLVGVEFRLLFERDKRKFASFPIPKSFLSALWLQFARAATENKSFRSCIQCGTAFEISPETGRTNRKFCSNACRSRYYRDRQDRAIQMAESGKSVRQIAKQLKTDVKTIKRWISNREE
jgi:hypothetical protein